MMNFHLSVTEQIAVLAMQIGIIIFAAKLCGDLAKKIKQPSVLGELLAGILIGPYVLGAIPLPFLHLPHGLFGFVPQTVTVSGLEEAVEVTTFGMYHTSLYALATLGSILLLFMSGLETDLRLFFRYSVVGTVVGIGGVIFSFAFGDMIGCLMIPGASVMDPRCLFLGILCTATSVGITARILSEKRKVDTPEGVTILAAAVIDDVLGIICLAVVTGIVASGASSEQVSAMKYGMIALKCIGLWLGATVVGLLLARYVAKFLKTFKSPTVFATLAFGIALMVAGLFEEAQLSMIIGAYVVGLSLSKTDISFPIQNALGSIYGLLVPIFFVVMGMLVDIRVFTDMNVLKMGLLYSALAVVAKVVGCAIPTLFMNFNLKGALRIGLGMVPRGEVALIIAGIGVGLTMVVDGQKIPVLDSKLFGVAIIMTLLTTVLTPPLLSVLLNWPGKGVRKETQDLTVVHTPFHFSSNAITELVLRRMVESFESEGFYLSSVSKDAGVLQIRRDDLSFVMMHDDDEFIFESNPDEVPFIKMIMYETFVDIHQQMGKLKDLANPQELRKEIFSAIPVTTEQAVQGENDHPHKKSFEAIEKALLPCCVKMNLESTSKEGIIRELVTMVAAGHSCITDAEACIRDVLERENVVTTCMQNYIALPHGRTDGTTALVAAVGFARQGLHFDALDGKDSKIFFLCLSPKSSNGPHIQFIAAIASTLRLESDVERLLACNSPDEVVSFFKG